MATTMSVAPKPQWSTPPDSSRGERLFYSFGPFVLMIVLWEGIRILSNAGPDKMPSLAAVVQAILRVAANGVLPDSLYHSVFSLCLAAVVSAAIGVVLGIAIGFSTKIAEFLLPILRYFNSLSGILWLPLFLVWFGFSPTTMTVTISYTFFFPVVFNTVIGVRTVPKVFRYAVLTMGGNWWDIGRGVLLPGALPNILTGVRAGFGYGWRAVIAAEMLLGASGLGYMILKAQAANLTDRILAGMVIIGITWSLMDYFILQPLEEATISRWALTQR